MTIHRLGHRVTAVSADNTASASMMTDSRRLMVVTDKGAPINSAIEALTELRDHLGS